MLWWTSACWRLLFITQRIVAPLCQSYRKIFFRSPFLFWLVEIQVGGRWRDYITREVTWNVHESSLLVLEMRAAYTEREGQGEGRVWRSFTVFLEWIAKQKSQMQKRKIVVTHTIPLQIKQNGKLKRNRMDNEGSNRRKSSLNGRRFHVFVAVIICPYFCFFLLSREWTTVSKLRGPLEWAGAFLSSRVNRCILYVYR